MYGMYSPHRYFGRRRWTGPILSSNGEVGEVLDPHVFGPCCQSGGVGCTWVGMFGREQGVDLDRGCGTHVVRCDAVHYIRCCR